mmetsp:Transcript_5163/g.11361  ORF Transcript_5163/g.11361 Transcript_5163/m.11361 type:complete len:170 (+) Transcript_5163:490-999(+)
MSADAGWGMVRGTYSQLACTPSPQLVNRTTFAPNSDYYVALLWRNLIGTEAVNVSGSTSSLFGFAHCARHAAHVGPGSIALVVINLSEQSAPVVADGVGYTGKKAVFALTSSGGMRSHSVLLNGRPLTPSEQGEIPSVWDMAQWTSDVVAPPLSVTMVVVPEAQASVCS